MKGYVLEVFHTKLKSTANKYNTRESYLCMKRKNLIIFLLLFLVTIFCLGYRCCAKNIYTGKKTIQAKFDFQAITNSASNCYLNLAWDTYFSREIPSELINEFKISKKNIGIIIEDLNEDNKDDVIATTRGIPYYCGKTGKECPVIILLSTLKKGEYKLIDIEINQLGDMPVTIMNSTSNGLKAIILNQKFLLKFNGKTYIVTNKE